MNNGRQDVTIVGAGLIGLSTAMELLQRKPGLKLTVVEKADGPASQQSGHNSGVIHSGIYYKPGSFKAQFCVEGRASMTQFCLDNEIPVWECGKLIVATNPAEEARLEDLWERGTNNAVEGLRIVDREEMGEIEPFVEGTKALYAPKTGIVDYRKVADVYSEKVQSLGGNIQFNSEVKNIIPNGQGSDGTNYTVETTSGEIETKYLVNCAGLHSDLIAAMSGVNPGLRIVPFRGEYYTLAKSSEHMVKGLIYPVPDPSFPFLGVHLTQTMKGWVEAGPNAVLAMKREGYRKRDFSFVDFGRTVTFPGFWKMSLKSWKVGLWEMNRSLRKDVFLNSLRKLMPSLKKSDLAPGGSGVRAQAVHSDGSLLDDFRIDESATAVHVLNAPSPGATSSLVIGNYIADKAEANFRL
ncbi:MAG: L-2-hydroxyglutarate oxidase [Chloroflexi bacterium]|nr:L-2-hydroxyglutarate oxidase [Chloroflexota bacterium]